MRKLFIIIYLLISSVTLAQTIEISEQELKTKLDSVLIEGNLLFKYEKSAWISTDLAQENKDIKKDFGGFFTYEDQEKIKVIILGKKSQNCIAEYIFENDFTKPQTVKIESRELSNKEIDLLEIRDKILINVSNEKYGISIPEGYSPNLILLPSQEKYKLYIIMGTSQNDLIPFGNDYFFIADKNGEIENWQKFHSRIIPGHTKMDGNKVSKFTHSHLKTTPLITATDICTFMLYAPLYEIDTFSVYSPTIGKYMTYSLKDNKILVSEK